MSGAFNGLEDIVQKRRNRKGIGFGSNMLSKHESAENLKHLKAEDLIQYGFESEFIGRLPVVTIFEHLEVEDLYKILRNHKSPIIVGKKRDFKSYGIDLQFEDEALHRIAENAFRERTGARGLVSAVERVLMKFEHTLASTDIRHLLVTPKTVDDPAEELDTILACPDDAEREAAFQKVMCCDEERLASAITEKIPEWKRAYGLDLPDTRIKLIIRHALEQQTDVEQAIE